MRHFPAQVGTGYRELFELIAMAISPQEVRDAMLSQLKAHPRQWLASAGTGVLARFCETLGVAAFLNFMLGLCCAVYWSDDKSDFMYAFEHYIPGFISDLLGLCAASGYQHAFELECLSF